ncbi:MAG TPA: hydroxyisourate hydrolase [Gemmatimonadales bacterium]|jgi:5-hydroxyisourate hydrolase
MTLSTHVLDTARGRPAAGITVTVSAAVRDGWKELGSAATDADGRIASLIPVNTPTPPGTTLRLRFELEAYFRSEGVPAFYPHVEIVFTLQDPYHHHVPLLISPFGYSTYRGS